MTVFVICVLLVGIYFVSRLNKKRIRQMDESEHVKVLATDFNGKSWNGYPFSKATWWLDRALVTDQIKLHPQSCARGDYAIWIVNTPDGEVIAEPGDLIVFQNDNLWVHKWETQ